MNTDSAPSRRDLRLFSLAVLAAAALLIALIFWAPGVLAVVACVAATAWVAGLILNDEIPRGRQLRGGIVPVLLGGAFALSQSARVAPVLIVALAAAGFAAATAVWLSERIGGRIHAGWMSAVLPVGWAISFAMMAVAYYIVVTPVGLVLRIFRDDPLTRKFDPEAKSYWIDSKTTSSVERYFRQF